MSTIADISEHQVASNLPGQRVGWFWAFAMAPAYLFISLSIMGGPPAADDRAAWAFVLVLAGLAPGTHMLEIVAWRLRARMGAPAWWTLSRHRNADKAVWMAAIVAFCLLPQSYIGWVAAKHWVLWWLGLIPLVFLIAEAVDALLATLGPASDTDDLEQETG